MREYQREWRKRNPTYSADAVRRYRAKPDTAPKLRARETLARAVRQGRIERPAECPRCGVVGKIQGHHKDYSKPLEVEWLCGLCHGQEHADERSEAA
jgi:ribosomal protein S27AE